MSKFAGLLVGGAEIAAGGALLGTGVGAAISPYLISAGAGQVMAGLGTLFSKGPVNGFATADRNPIAPWKYVYGRARVGGTPVYIHQWPEPPASPNLFLSGGSDVILDMVVVLAAHACQSVDVLLFDQQRIQIDTAAAPPGAGPGAGTSFTPVQQTVKFTGSNPTRIQRVKGVVTVTLSNNIPFLIAGDRVKVSNVPGDLTLNGTAQVAEIISQVAGTPGSITFTYLSGGPDSDVVNAGWITTLWADYGRSIYFEPILGKQALGETFASMIQGTPLDGNMGQFVRPENAEQFGGSSNGPNPWTADCSLQGKTAFHIRIHVTQKYYSGGLPQISCLMHGKNDILDPRTMTRGYTENSVLCINDFLADKTLGFGLTYGTQLPYAQIIAGANVCDEPVPLASSTGSPPVTEPLWACNGQFTADMHPGEILQNMLTSCMGRRTSVGGQWVIWPAAWTGNSIAIGSNPGGGVIPLGDFNAIAAGPIRWRPTVSKRELYNGVKGTYISEANKWMASDFPPYCQDDLHGYSPTGGLEPQGSSADNYDANLTIDGGRRKWLDIQLPFTISSRQAQQSAKVELLRRRTPGAQGRGSGTLALNMAGYQITPLDLGLLTIAPLSWTAKQIEFTDTRFSVEKGNEGGPSLMVETDFQETGPEIYNWSTLEELSPQGYKEPLIPGVGSFNFFATETVPGFNVPFPWEPAGIAPLIGDAMFPGPVAGSPPENEGRASFGMQVQYGTDTQGNPTVTMDITGVLPPNDLSGIGPPQITVVAGTSGSLPGGVKFLIAASAIDTSTPPQNSQLSVPIAITLPAGPSNGSLTVTVNWPSGSNGGEIYMAEADSADGYFFQAALTAGETTFTIDQFDQSSPGAPDATFDHLAVAWKKVIHGGVWAQQVQAVTADTITIAGDGMAANLWAGYTVSLLGKLDSTQPLIILNMPVASSSPSSGTPAEFVLTIGTNTLGDQLPDLTTLLEIGDLLVMRFKATFTDTSFSDVNIANPYFPLGAAKGSPPAPILEAGHIAMMLTGPDAGDAQTIASVGIDINGNYTEIILAGSWRITPDAGDIVTIVEAAWGAEIPTQFSPVPNRGAVSGVVASALVTNLAQQTWMFIVRAQTANDLNGDDAFAPVRENFIFGSQGTRTIGTSQTMLFTDRIILIDASAGPVVYTMLPFDQIPNQSVYFLKIDGSANPATIVVSGVGDVINGSITSVTLAAQGDWTIGTVTG